MRQELGPGGNGVKKIHQNLPLLLHKRKKIGDRYKHDLRIGRCCYRNREGGVIAKQESCGQWSGGIDVLNFEGFARIVQHFSFYRTFLDDVKLADRIAHGGHQVVFRIFFYLKPDRFQKLFNPIGRQAFKDRGLGQ